MSDIDMRLARKRFNGKRASSKQRGIPFLFTFDEWLAWWLATGRYDEYGHRWVMARIGDRGAYEPGNVVCKAGAQNALEASIRDCVGVWFPSEDAELMTLAPDWQAAAAKIGRTPAACRTRYRRLTTLTVGSHNGLSGPDRVRALQEEFASAVGDV